MQLVRFDWAMKYLLRNKANFDVLEGFLSELLKKSILIETVLESESIVFFDLGIGKDYLYKGSTVFEGLHYGDALALNAEEKELYQSRQSLLIETPDQVFPEYYLIKVTQFQEKVKDKLDEWIYFFKHGEIKQEFSAQGIQHAAEKLNILKLTPEERQVYEVYREFSHDDGSFNVWAQHIEQKAKAEGEAIGEVRGEARGETNAMRRMATNLLKQKIHIQIIANASGLSLNQIKQLQQEMQCEPADNC